MLLTEEINIQVRDSRSILDFSHNWPMKLGPRRLGWRGVGGGRIGAVDGDCRICAASGDLLARLAGAEGSKFVGQIGGFSHESEHDLAVMVSDFLENRSAGEESMFSSDSDSGISDPNRFAEKVLFLKNSVDQFESALSSSVQTYLLSLHDTDLLSSGGSQCHGRCIRQALVKLLCLSGYDAAVCSSKWQGFGKVPGGDHEYIDVIHSGKTGSSERLIVDIDFRSHFEIARAITSYDAVFNSLPVIYIGSMSKLKLLLQIMVDAAKFSLKQNSMPLPPWRSLAYLQAKWQSEYVRVCCLDAQSNLLFDPLDHPRCIGRLNRLKSSLLSD
ncbi:uncharacterized protein LOC110022914 [Phalaenopsis equestris]|uniref:uncharacterized protein LOC110022914 n=1 Tax=Phalaenopsis equestris TaxID=78828 RepID=UPI0009E5F70D|nr:uncharacterized protein LOC110022914 [Phalaenopsis equestris]XP_020577732.1 uncharacterized protein LOC110022914 [Phalaenopsis equestris]